MSSTTNNDKSHWNFNVDLRIWDGSLSSHNAASLDQIQTMKMHQYVFREHKSTHSKGIRQVKMTWKCRLENVDEKYRLIFLILVKSILEFILFTVQFSSVQLLSRVWLFVTTWIAARQASLCITNSWNLLKLMAIESVVPSSHLILCCLLLLLPPTPPQHQGLFQWVNSSHEVAKVLEFQLQHQSFQWTPRTDLL